jgi:hypothetical protein
MKAAGMARSRSSKAEHEHKTAGEHADLTRMQIAGRTPGTSELRSLAQHLPGDLLHLTGLQRSTSSAAPWSSGGSSDPSRPLKMTPNYTNRVEVSGLFWHFVDLVWIFLFPILYLL